jgi:acylglycerol lipase
MARYEAGAFLSPRGPRLATHAWLPAADAPCRAAAIFILHGYGAHGLFPTVRALGEHLAAHGYVSRSLDFEGAGASDGLPGLIEDAAHLASDALAFVAATVADGTPAFLVGTSMGGGLALLAADGAADGLIAGCVLLAPLIVVSPEAVPSAPVVALLRALCAVVPWAPLVGGSSGDASAQYADPILREECVADAMAYKGRMRLATAAALLQLRRAHTRMRSHALACACMR